MTGGHRGSGIEHLLAYRLARTDYVGDSDGTGPNRSHEGELYRDGRRLDGLMDRTPRLKQACSRLISIPRLHEPIESHSMRRSGNRSAKRGKP